MNENTINHEEEFILTHLLLCNLRDSGWMGKDVVIVTCDPVYSGILAQRVNHVFAGKSPLEHITLDFPQKGSNQIYSPRDSEYVPFDRYLNNWVKENIQPNEKYLFVSNTMFSGKLLNKLRLLVKSRLSDLDNFKFACLCLQSDSSFNPDYFVHPFDKGNEPKFYWEEY